MPTFIDIHEIAGATLEDIASAHARDLGVQNKHGVNYFKYWVNEKSGKAFCMCTAPSSAAADAVHREAHGLTAGRVMEITDDMADAFMGASEVDHSGAALLPGGKELDPATRTVFFTDIVESTSLTQQFGDDAAMEMIQAHDRIVRAALSDARGREIKHTGDGIMAAFTSAVAAVRCGMAVQQNFAQHRTQNPAQPLRVRIGLASGEPIEHHNDLFGSAVQLAARLCAHAQPEQILMSNAVAELCIGKALPLRDLGTVTLKGFERPVRVHAI